MVKKLLQFDCDIVRFFTDLLKIYLFDFRVSFEKSYLIQRPSFALRHVSNCKKFIVNLFDFVFPHYIADFYLKLISLLLQTFDFFIAAARAIHI